ncbi:MAG: hypothetical protein ACFB0B_17265 [Thermonemataceae bacterium]
MKKIPYLWVLVSSLLLFTACDKTEKTSENYTSAEEASPKKVERTEQEKPLATNNGTHSTNTNAFTEIEVTLAGSTLISSKDAYSEVSFVGKQTSAGVGITTQVGDNEFVLMLLFTNTTKAQVEQVPFQIVQEDFLGKKDPKKPAVVLSLTDYTQKTPKTYQMADGKATVEKFSEEEVIISFSGRVSANTGDLIKKENLQLITGKLRAKKARFTIAN